MTHDEKLALAELAGHTNRIAQELEGQGSPRAAGVLRAAHRFEHLAEIPPMFPTDPPAASKGGRLMAEPPAYMGGKLEAKRCPSGVAPRSGSRSDLLMSQRERKGGIKNG